MTVPAILILRFTLAYSENQGNHADHPSLIFNETQQYRFIK